MTAVETDRAAKKVEVLIPVLLAGGTEAQTLYLVRALKYAGSSVGVCCYFEASRPVVEEFEREGARVTLLGLGSSSEARRLRTLFEVGREIFSHLRRVRPDVVHVQYIAPGLVPILAARTARVPAVFATVHQLGEPYGLIAKFALRLAARLSSAFFCVSRSVEESWFGDSALFDPADMGKRRHFTLYDCVDVERFAREADQADTPAIREGLGLGSRPVVGVVGRLRREKGHDELLEAFALVAKAIPDAALLVVGEGQERAHLEERARALGLENRVWWLGARGPAELPGLYAVMDVGAVPSLFEGFGLVAVEAMAAARPVVAFATGGLTEIVVDGLSGTLIPRGDCSGLARAVADLLAQRTRAVEMGMEGRKIAQARFSEDAFRSLILSAYQSLAA
jgi:glycosyltransferase involved in cell wall biosynthesis